jgi:hypothetical protein
MAKTPGFTSQIEPRKIVLPGGYYPNIESLAQMICALVKKETEVEITYNYNAITGRLKFGHTDYIPMFVCPDKYLLTHLGFPVNEIELEPDPKTNPHGKQTLYYNKALGADERRAYLDDINSIFVYSDVTDYQIVGNTLATLMGVIPTSDKHGQQQSWQFNPLQYIRVPHRSIQSITMKLCTPTGARVPFFSGDSLCRLHFRRKLL